MERRHQHPLDIDLLAFVANETDAAKTIEVGDHLETCLVCRVSVGRLRRAGIPKGLSVPPVGPVSAVSSSVLDALAAKDRPAQVAAGQLWLAGTGQRIVVWVASINDADGFAVVHAGTFDVAGADDTALIHGLPGYNQDVAIFGSVSGALPLTELTVFLAHLDIEDDLRRVMDPDAATAALGVVTGPPLNGATDERREFRQLLADDLAALDPIVGEDDDEPTSEDAARDHLRVELSERRGERCAISVFPQYPTLPPGLRPVAHVQELDSRILVAFGSWEDRPASEWNLLYEFVLGVGEPTLALAVPSAPFETAVFPLRHLHDAFEPPHARNRVAPRPFFEPLPLVKALDHYLDTAVFCEIADASLLPQVLTPPEIDTFYGVFAAQSIANLRATRATLGKNRALKRLSEADATEIAEALADLSESEFQERLREIAQR